MEWLNYHHLFYFWVVAKEGSVVRASARLGLAHPTISGQVRRLEEVLGEKLFVRRGRELALTEPGQIAFRYADEIFSLGREFVDTLRGRNAGRPLRFAVGVADVLPPSLVRKMLEPAFHIEPAVRLSCRADKAVDELVTELALHRLDVVIADGPVGAGAPVRVFNHLLGERGKPFLRPGTASAVARSLDQWFSSLGVQPRVVAECDDSALVKEFGQAGMGVFAAPSILEEEVRRHHGVQIVGRSHAVRQQFYAISAERKIKHPAVIAVCDSARRDIFAREAR